jgi:predicted kinase
MSVRVFAGVREPVGFPHRQATAFVLVGAPGSGKTTKARQLREEDPRHRYILGRDTEREANGCLPVAEHPEQEDAITVALEAGAVALLTLGWDVIVDTTNVQPGALDRWRRVADRAGAQVVVVDLTGVDVDTCIANNAARAAAGGRDVPEQVIRAMHGQGRATR